MWLLNLLGPDLVKRVETLESELSKLQSWRGIHEMNLQDENARLRAELAQERATCSKLMELLEKKVSAPVTVSPGVPVRQADARASAIQQMTTKLMEETA